MKYISLEIIQKARLTTVSTPDALQAAYIDGWNDCIEVLVNHAPAVEIEPDGLLQVLEGGKIELTDDPGIPDCEECSFSGLLTED